MAIKKQVLVTNNDVQITKAGETKVSFEDKKNTTENQTIESVSNSNYQFTLTGELTLNVGDLVKVDSGNYQGYYIVKQYTSGSHTVVVDSTSKNFELFADETYTDNKPKMYKVALAYQKGLIKEGQLPSEEVEQIDVTAYDDPSSQFVSGSVTYSDLTLTFLYDPNKRPIQILQEAFDNKDNVVVFLSKELDRYKQYSFYIVNFQKLGGKDLKFNEFENYEVTLKVNQGSRKLEIV